MRRRRSRAENLAALLRAPKRLGAVPASEPDSEEEGEVREANKRRRCRPAATASASAGASGCAYAIAEAIAAPPAPAIGMAVSLASQGTASFLNANGAPPLIETLPARRKSSQPLDISQLLKHDRMPPGKREWIFIPSLSPGGTSYRAKTQRTTERVLTPPSTYTTLLFTPPHFNHYYHPSGSNGSGPEAYSRLYLSG